MTSYKQLAVPNLNLKGNYSGLCLGWVTQAIGGSIYGEDDDADGTAQAAFNELHDLGYKIHTESTPIGMWVPIWFDLQASPYGQAGMGHVAWCYDDSNTTTIYDSEVASGARQPYHSISELLNYFGSAGVIMKYLGWTETVAGVVVLQPIETKTQINKRKREKKMVLIQLTSEFKGFDLTYPKNKCLALENRQLTPIEKPEQLNALIKLYGDIIPLTGSELFDAVQGAYIKG